MANPYESPQPTPGDQVTHGIIPYRNPHALIACYFGIFFLLCGVTPLPLGLIPLILGIVGLRKSAQNPVIRGSVHAWIGIVLGALSTLGSGFMLAILTIDLLRIANVN